MDHCQSPIQGMAIGDIAPPQKFWKHLYSPWFCTI